MFNAHASDNTYTMPRASHITVQACSAVGESCAELECGCS